MKSGLMTATTLSLVCLAMAGCDMITSGSIKMQPRAISYAAQENLVQFEKPKAKLIRVAKFTDKRPVEERKGFKPSKWLLIVYNWQIGTAVSGDSTWSEGKGSDSVATAISGGIKDCLKASNFFEAATTEDNTAPTGGKGVILKGEIEAFSASEDITEYEFLFAVDYTKKPGTPKGKCKLNYTLVDAETNQELKHNTIEVTIEESQSDASAAGLQALRQAQTRLANEVTKTLLEM